MLKGKKIENVRGLSVQRVIRNSDAFRAGVRAGDRVVSVNGETPADELDFSFLTAEEILTLGIVRKGTLKHIELRRESGSLLGIELVQLPVQSCKNRCIFCFIDQLPDGMRKRLYIKDEDYRHSFLNGSYITLTSLSDRQLERIAERGISPLYISVHATDPDVRRRMLRNRHAGKILEQLKFLVECDIAIHSQIVVCPGYNDGEVLQKTLEDLLCMDERMESVAVVPVGLTRFRKAALEPVSARAAKQILTQIRPLSDRDWKKYRFRRLFASDEFYVKAGIDIPQSNHYEGYPQIENGVGLIRCLINEWEKLQPCLPNASSRETSGREQKSLILTSVSAAPYVRRIVEDIQRVLPELSFWVHPVKNSFFGESVTVAGLLTARDMISQIKKHKSGYDRIFIPSASLNYRGYTLDGYSVDRIKKIVGKPVIAPSSLAQMIGECGIEDIDQHG